MARAPSSERQSARKSPGLLLPASLLAATGGWGLTAAGAGAPTLADHYGGGLVSVGLLTTVFAVGYAGLQVPAGHLIDRFSVRSTALVGMGLTALAYVVAIVLPQLGATFVARGVAGAGSAVGFVAGAELARRAGTGPVGLGVFGGMGIGAGGLAVAVVPGLEPVLGWGAGWITCAAVATGAALVVWLTVPAGRGLRRPQTAITRDRPHLLLDAELYRLTAIHAATFGLGVVLSNWAAVILTDRWKMEQEVASLIASLILVLTIVSRPLGGSIIGRYPGSARLLTVGSLFVSAACTVALAFPSTAVVAAAAALALGVASGLPFSAALAGAQTWRPDRPAAAVGVLNAGANFVVVLGTPVVAGAIEAGRTVPALLALAVVWLVPVVALPRTLRMRPSRR